MPRVPEESNEELWNVRIFWRRHLGYSRYPCETPFALSIVSSFIDDNSLLHGDYGGMIVLLHSKAYRRPRPNGGLSFFNASAVKTHLQFRRRDERKVSSPFLVFLLVRFITMVKKDARDTYANEPCPFILEEGRSKFSGVGRNTFTIDHRTRRVFLLLLVKRAQTTWTYTRIWTVPVDLRPSVTDS